MLLVIRRSGDPPTQRLILGYELIYELYMQIHYGLSFRYWVYYISTKLCTCKPDLL